MKWVVSCTMLQYPWICHAVTKFGEEKEKNLQIDQCELGQLPHLTLFRSSQERCSIKKVFLKISQNSQENTCARVSFSIKLQATACIFIKKETLTEVFSCKFWEILRTIFLQNTPERLFLVIALHLYLWL